MICAWPVVQNPERYTGGGGGEGPGGLGGSGGFGGGEHSTPGTSMKGEGAAQAAAACCVHAGSPKWV